MKHFLRATGVTLLAALVLAFGTRHAQGSGPGPLLTMQTFTTGTNQPVGVDAHYTSGAVDSLIVSVNHIDGGGGLPYNFVQVPINGGSVTQFGPTAGLPDEISITTVKPGQPGGWTVGDMFVPGPAGTVKRLDAGGNLSNFANVQTHFATDYIRGEMAFDRTGLFDNALISASVSGVISKIAATGASVTLTQIVTTVGGQTNGVEIEGLTVVPNNAAYGPWAGRIIASSPQTGMVYAIAPDGTYTSTDLGIATARSSSTTLPNGINDWESAHVIPANADFYQVEYNHNSVLKLTAAQLAPYVGQILLVQEATPAQLWLINWDPTAQAFTHTLLAEPRDPGDVSTNGNYNLEQGNFVPVLGSISGTLYCDLNKNSQLDSGEPGIPGQTVTLTGPVNATTTTDANGFYQFNNLPSGSYSIVSPTIADNKNLETTNPLTVNLPDGGNSTNNNFGYVTGVISGTLYCDLNKNSQLDGGEPGISGITVTLNGPGGTQTTTTDANGFYSFGNLLAGTYTVTAPSTANGKNLETTSPLTVVLPAGGNKPNNNFGYVLGTISGTTYVDSNTNLQLDSGEPLLPNVTVTLSQNNMVVATTPTDSNGFYQFTNLPAGTYTVSVPAAVGTNTLETPSPLTVVLPAGGNKPNNNFGYIPPAPTGTIGDTVWSDLNSNGVQDAGEPGIPGVTVTLNGPGGTKTAVTDANGMYLFTGLAAGTYTVSTSGSPLSGLVETHDLDGVATPNTTQVPLAAGQTRLDADFGYSHCGALIIAQLGGASNYTVLGYDKAQIALSGGGVFNPVTGLSGTAISGDIGLGNGGTFQMSAGTIQGTAYLHTGINANLSGSSLITGGVVKNTATDAAIEAALADASKAAKNISQMAPTQTFGNITSGVTIVGNGGVNVININSISLTNPSNGAVVLKGGANDTFFINISQKLALSGGTSLKVDGVDPANVIYNLGPSAGNFNPSGGSSVYGTILDANWGGPVSSSQSVSLSFAYVYGRVIAGKIAISSSTQIISQECGM